MKLTVFLFFVSVFTVSANTVFSQKVTLNVENATLRDVFRSLKEQTGYMITYSEDKVDSDHATVSINLNEVDLTDALSLILADLPYTFSVTGQRVLIVPARVPAHTPDSAPIPETEEQDDRQMLMGIVHETDGRPLGYTTVYNVTSNTGVATDEKGEFLIRVKLGDKLRFSFIGYRMREIEVTQAMLASSYRLNITMEEASGDIAAATVISDGIRERNAESYTGSASVFKREELQRVGNSNVLESLKNLEPAFYFPVNFEMGSDPNIVPTFSMRGGTSFFGASILEAESEEGTFRSSYANDPNMPLFILDGFVVSAEQVFDLNMNLLEDVTVLKDAAAKALYGSKAANGVVVIQSLRLRSDKPQITYNGSVELQMPDLSSYNLCNALEKLDVEYREIMYGFTTGNAGRNTNDRNPEYYVSYYNLRKRVLEGLDTYWLSKPVRFGYGQRHNVDVQMGTGDLRVGFNANYNNTVGVMKGSDRTAISLGMSLNYTWKNLRWMNKISYTATNSADSPYGSYDQYARLNPYEELYDEYGLMKRTFGGITGTYNQVNPMYNAFIGTEKTYGYDQVTNNTQLRYNVAPGLFVEGAFSFTVDNRRTSDYIPANHTSQANVNPDDKGRITAINERLNRLNGHLTVNYARTFNDVHELIGNVRFEIGEDKSSSVAHTAVGLPADNLNNILYAMKYLTDGSASRPRGNTSVNRELGALGLFSYSYAQKYAADLTLRTNATSVFGVNNRWAPFWSFGLLWNIHKEQFMSNTPIRTLKLKASVGTSGNQNFSTNRSVAIYQYQLGQYYYAYPPETINATNQPLRTSGSWATNMENPGLKWERKLEYNLNFIASLYGFSIDAETYLIQTKDAVTRLNAAPSTGYSSFSSNIGELETKGFSVKVNYQIFRRGSNYLNLHGYVVHEKRVVTNISDAMKTYNDAIMARYSQAQTMGSNTMTSTGSIDNAGLLTRLPAIQWYDGADPSAIWVVQSAGIDPATGKEVFIGSDGLFTFIYKGSDLQPIGTTQPKFRGNFGFNGEYKGFGVSVTFGFWTGGQHYNQTLIDMVENVNIRYNFDRRVLTERWQQIDQSVYFRSTGYMNVYNGNIYDLSTGNYSLDNTLTRATSRFVQNRNELTINSIKVSYRAPQKVLDYVRMKDLTLSVYMNDVATFSSIGVERGTAYPFARKMNIALTATF